MYLHCQFDTSVTKSDNPEQYLRQFEVSVRGFGEDDDEYVVGKLGMTQVLWADAIALGASLAHVFDCGTQGLDEVHMILTEGRKKAFRPNLEIGDVTDHVIFLHSAAIHPSFHEHRHTILDAAFRILGGASLVVMWNDTTGLCETDLLGLGFGPIPDSELVYRHSASEPPLSLLKFHDDAVHPIAKREHEEWVNQEWKRLGEASE